MAKEVRYKIQKQGEKSSNPDQEYEWVDYNGAVPGFPSGNKDLSKTEVNQWIITFRDTADGQANEAWGRDPDRTGSKPFRLNVVQDRIINT